MFTSASSKVYLHAYDSASHSKAALARYIDWYNRGRPHSSQSLDKKTPDKSYFATLTATQRAAWAVNPSCPPRRSAGTSQALSARPPAAVDNSSSVAGR